MAHEPHLAVVCGGAGAGKTTLARRLVRHVGAALVDIDPCTDFMLAKGLEGFGLQQDDRDSPRYKSLFRDAIHKQLFSIAREQLEHTQLPVVLVAPLTTERRWSAKEFAKWILKELRLKDKPRLTIIYVFCDGRERLKRIRQRNFHRDAQKLVDEAGYMAASEDPHETPVLAQFKKNEMHSVLKDKSI